MMDISERAVGVLMSGSVADETLTEGHNFNPVGPARVVRSQPSHVIFVVCFARFPLRYRDTQLTDSLCARIAPSTIAESHANIQ
jgi:hypothetical protein